MVPQPPCRPGGPVAGGARGHGRAGAYDRGRRKEAAVAGNGPDLAPIRQVSGEDRPPDSGGRDRSDLIVSGCSFCKDAPPGGVRSG